MIQNASNDQSGTIRMLGRTTSRTVSPSESSFETRAGTAASDSSTAPASVAKFEPVRSDVT